MNVKSIYLYISIAFIISSCAEESGNDNSQEKVVAEEKGFAEIIETAHNKEAFTTEEAISAGYTALLWRKGKVKR